MNMIIFHRDTSENYHVLQYFTLLAAILVEYFTHQLSKFQKRCWGRILLLKILLYDNALWWSIQTHSDIIRPRCCCCCCYLASEMDWWSALLRESSTVLYNQSKKSFVSKVNSLHLQPMDNNQSKPSSIGLVRSGDARLTFCTWKSPFDAVHRLIWFFHVSEEPTKWCCHQNRYRSCFAIGIRPKKCMGWFHHGIVRISPSSMVQWNITRGCRGTCLGGPAMVADQPNEFQVPQIGATRRSNAILAGFVPSSRNTTFLHPRCK